MSDRNTKYLNDTPLKFKNDGKKYLIRFKGKITIYCKYNIKRRLNY